MSIDGINRQIYVRAYNSNFNKAVDKVNKSENVDRIEISDLGKSLRDYSLDSSLGSAQRVAEIKSKIDNGTYNVDARLTAKSLLNVMKEKNE